MREIKFRGKRIDNGEWRHGDLLTEYIHHEGLTIVENGCIYYEVNPDTLGQYTGLKDKNGVEIYEDDIVRATSRYDSGNMVIVWDRGEFIQVLCEDYATYQPGMGHYSIKNFDKKIIGNIHDNPELIAPDTDCQEGVCPL